VKELDEILKLIERLRAEGGCPWDREQTIMSLKKDLREEYEEVIQAIDKRDHENLKEEIGDLIWTLLLMVQIASEEKHFNAGDVLRGTRDKIIRRHPHVFGKEKAETPEDAVRIVERVKEMEKNGLQKTKEKA
jgi:uncharacterized protein YabN with tetrapyrrole methylase and pyrophosphatase domain